MRLFQHRNRQRTERSQRVYALFELTHTIVDFCAAFAFVIGSVLFFWAEYETTAIWFFVVGSCCFALKPTLRLVREFKLLRIGDTEGLADRLDK